MKVGGRKIKITAFLMIISLSGGIDAGWIDQKAEGWAWYEDREKSKEVEAHEEEVCRETAVAILEKVRQDLEEKLATALLNPTSENIQSYMREQKRWVDQSHLFATQWSRALLDSPELDNTILNPVSHYGAQVQKNVKREHLASLIGNVSREYGLMFFYEGEKLASKAFSKVVKSFADYYNWNILAVSLDGAILSDFPYSRADNGISAEFPLEAKPALFAVNPKTNEVIPLAFGLASIDQIENNCQMQFGDLAGGQDER